MSQPNPYNREFNFSNFQAANPASPLPAGHLDAEFSRIKAVIDQIRTSIRAMQRDDFAIGNDTVGLDQLKPEVSVGLNPPTIWASGVNYVARDTVITGQIFYQCLVSHVSGVFATDLAAGDWTLLADFTAVGTPSAALTSYDNTASGLTASNVQAAIDEVVVDSATAAITGGTINNTVIGGSAPAAGSFLAVTSNGALLSPIPAGVILDYAGAVEPAGWLFPYGQTISRATYAALFAAIGVTYGAGDGSTTFTLPDYRGRVAAGQDDMGGVSANRLTGASGGVNGDTLGAAGGLETHTITDAQISAHTHTFADTAATSSAGNHSHVVSGAITLSTAGGVQGFTVSGANGALSNPATNTTGAHTHTVTVGGTTSSVGSDAAHNNVQPTIIVNKIIKL